MPLIPFHPATGHTSRLAAVLLVSVALLPTGRAADVLDIGSYVDFCTLIVKCRVERSDQMLRFRVLESWKGHYSPDLFASPPPDGYLPGSDWHGYDKLTDGQEVVFFCSANDYETKIRGLSAAYPVIDGKIVYDSSGWLGGELYSVDGFKRVIIGYSNTNARGAVFGGAAAGWLRESAHRERFRYAALISPLEVPPESAPARGADGPENGDSNRSAAIVLVVAASLLVAWLVYRSLHRRMLRWV